MTASENSYRPSAERMETAVLTGDDTARRPNRVWAWSLDPKILESQPAQNATTLYFARKVSKYVTSVLLKLGLSANQATALWGLASVLNSYLIYRAMLGQFYLVPVIFAMYFVVVIVDCSDGEIARVRRTASPLGGKLLDGIWHKATEYSLLRSAWTWSPSPSAAHLASWAGPCPGNNESARKHRPEQLSRVVD